MSYTIDIYKGCLKPTRKFLDFALFVSFFPQLVAGPIERASHLLPQILSKRKVTLHKFYEGCYLILWGLFLKVFVADNLARQIDPIFASGSPYNGAKVLLGVYAFAFQIFGDFAGYSNIARGLGKCMGFDIMVNFNLPYFATNPSDFWKRWHISLSTWLRDYLYIPLGGNRRSKLFTYRNLAITMLLGGLWHGAAWTYIAWGAYWGILLIGHRLCAPLLKRIPIPKNSILVNLWFYIRVIFFFQLVCLGWLLFRAQNMHQVYRMLYSLFCNFKVSQVTKIDFHFIRLLFYAGLLIVIQLVQYRKNDLLVMIRINRVTTIAFCYAIILLMMFFGVLGSNQFIYFQF